MKKNLISVIILALTFANFVLTALLLFTVLPETKKANEMITAVCSAIDLELNSGAATGTSNLPIEQITTYSVNGGESITTNLKSTDTTKNHYVVVSVSLSLNNKSDNYEKYSPEVLAEKDSIIQDDIIQIISSYSDEDFSNNVSEVKELILSDMQSMFGSDYVVGVNFSGLTLD
jgi:flagellar FliL protein